MTQSTPRSLRAPSLAPADRAPRLRRIAELIDLQAERSRFPDRAHQLAREMRARACEIECGMAFDVEDLAEALKELTG